MVIIRKAKLSDRDFWFTLDKHISQEMFEVKVRDGMAYVLLEDDVPAGLLRCGMFWDNTPFCNLVYVAEPYQKKGYGAMLMRRWEIDVRDAGYLLALVSTQADEDAQHFYRKIGYKDCGSLLLPFDGFEQPTELFLGKRLYKLKNWMSPVLLSADGPISIYYVPRDVAEDLENYCLEFVGEWLPESPDAAKYRKNGVLVFNERAFIEYLNKYRCKECHSYYHSTLPAGMTRERYNSHMPYFNF